MKYIIVLSIAMTGILVGCNNSTAEEPVGNTAQTAPITTTVAPSVTVLPSFPIVNAGNQVINLSDFKGKKVFVNLWATWCPPCRAEIPSIEKLAAKTDKNKAAFVMLSLDDNFEKAKSFAAANNMSLPVYYPAANLPELFNVEGIPVTFIFNEKGELIYQEDGSTNYDTKVFFDILNQ